MGLKFRIVTTVLLSVCAISTHAAATPARTPTVQELIGIIKSGADALAKTAAIEKLAETSAFSDDHGNGDIELLIDVARTTQSPFIGKAAVRGLTSLYKTRNRAKVRYIEPFTQLLANAKTLPGIRSEIAQCFLETLEKDGIKDREAARVLIDIAKNRGEQNLALRGKCIEAVGAFGSADNIGLLCDLLSDPESYIKEAAAKGIALLLDKDIAAATSISPAAVAKIIDMMKDERLEIETRVTVIRNVGQLIAANTPGAGKAVDELIRMARFETNDPIVHASILALSVIGTPQAIDALIAAYGDYFNATDPKKERDVPVREAVAKAMITLLSVQAGKHAPDSQAVHNIAALLNKILDDDPMANVKQAAIYAVANLVPDKFKSEQRPATQALIALLERQPADSSLTTSIVVALEALTRVNYGPKAKRWNEWFAGHYPQTTQ